MAKTPTPVTTKLPEATATTGKTCSLACNLPHGLQVIHKDRTLRIHGANQPKAIQTSTALSGMWGITHNVDEDWFDDWAATEHPAVVNGHIVKNTAGKIEDHADALGDAIPTDADQLDPDAPGEGVTQRDDDEA